MRRDSMGGELYRDAQVASVTPYLNKASDKVTGVLAPKTASGSGGGLDASKLPGIVVDDTKAKLTGKWGDSQGLPPYVGDGYVYASPDSGSEARYEFAVPKGGKYEVRIAWMPHANRSTKSLCTIERKGQRELRLRLNQREGESATPPFHAIGKFDFPAGINAIILSTEGSDGNVHADAIQLVEVP